MVFYWVTDYEAIKDEGYNIGRELKYRKKQADVAQYETKFTMALCAYCR